MSQYFYCRGEFIMSKTKHFGDRIQQRGILSSTIELAQEYGQSYGDKYILGKKEIIFALKNIVSKIQNVNIKTIARIISKEKTCRQL